MSFPDIKCNYFKRIILFLVAVPNHSAWTFHCFKHEAPRGVSPGAQSQSLACRIINPKSAI